MIRFDPPDDETRLLQESTRRFLSGTYTLERRSRMLEHPPEGQPEHWREIAALGWLGACVPEAAGGLGLPASSLVPFLEELGAGLVLEPVVPVAMDCAPTLAAALPDEQAETLLAPILDGGSPQVIARGQVTARREGRGLVLCGRVPLVPGGASASAFWVVATCDGGPVLARVSAGQVERRAFRMIDGQAAAAIVVDGAACASEDVIEECADALRRGQEMAQVGRLAELSGLIGALHSDTLDHVKMREQFGRPIGRFQVIQHRMAEMFIRREEARSMARLAAEAMDGEDARFRARLLAAAWIRVSDNARAVLRDAVQLHGGMGMTDELRVGHLVKRLLVTVQNGGGRAAHLERFRSAG